MQTLGCVTGFSAGAAVAASAVLAEPAAAVVLRPGVGLPKRPGQQTLIETYSTLAPFGTYGYAWKMIKARTTDLQN